MKHYLIAHDLGTSGDKATLYDADGSLIRSITTSYPAHFFNGNWAEQNPEDWWNAFCQSTKALLDGMDANEVAALSFSGQMMGCVPVDRSGRALRPAIIWADQRATRQAEEVLAHSDLQTLYRITGHRISASYSLEKLMWLRDHEGETFRQIHCCLQAKDYIIQRLTGRFATDYTDACGTNAFDLAKRCWSDAILESVGLDQALFPEALPSTAVAGEVSPTVAKLCGLAPFTPVVMGAGDGICATTGAASIQPGDTYHYLGSSSWIACTDTQPYLDPQMRTFNWVHMVPDCYCPMGTMQAAGNSFNYIRDMLCDGEALRCEAQGRSIYEVINEMLTQSPVGSRGLIYLPYLLGERSPRWNPSARGAFIGLTMEHSRADLVHAALEGVLMNLSLILDALRGLRPVQQLRLIGGLAQSDAICQMLADIFGVEAVLMDKLEEATSTGAAVCAGVGVGLLEDFSAVHRFIHPSRHFNCREDVHAAYAPVKALFEEAYESTRALCEKLGRYSQ